MKCSTLVAILVFLASAVGALTAAWLYIRRREKELDEYEQLLFSDDLDLDEEPASAEEACQCEDCAEDTCEEQDTQLD